jgi:multiple sugar transport system permease protein
MNSAYLSLTKYTLITDPEWIGLYNFIRIFKDTRMAKAMMNIVLYVAGLVSINTVLGLALALVFRRQGIFNQIIRTTLFLPAVTGSIATANIWFFIFTGEDYGLANTILHWLGRPSLTWLATPSLAVPLLISIGVWGGAGFTMIFFLAGLQGIPQEYNEAAAIDGATPLQRLWYITIPLLRPIFLFVVITGIIGSFQLFDTSYVLFASTENVGGVLDSALTPVLYLYDRAFRRFQMGYASSIAWVLFFIIVMLAMINLWVGRANQSD